MARSPLAALAGALAVAALARTAVSGTVPATTVTTDTRACQPPFDALPFCDTSLPTRERILDLIDRVWQNPSWIPPLLTARHGGGGSPGPSDNITALGIPE
jgi:hypothetical protein